MRGAPIDARCARCVCARLTTGRSMFSDRIHPDYGAWRSVSIVNGREPAAVRISRSRDLVGAVELGLQRDDRGLHGSGEQHTGEDGGEEVSSLHGSSFRARGDAGSTPGQYVLHIACHCDRDRDETSACMATAPADGAGYVKSRHRRSPELGRAGPVSRPEGRVYDRLRPGRARRGVPVRWASRGEKMLTRDQLTDDQWRTVRNTPHHVAIAVSAAGGSIFDEMLERAAAMAGIVDALEQPPSARTGHRRQCRHHGRAGSGAALVPRPG